MIDIRKTGAGRFQAISNRIPLKRRVVLLAGKAFFLRGRDNATVRDQRGGAVVMVRKCRE